MGKWIKSKAVHSGRNFDTSSYKDDRYVRCSRCGWICQLDREARHPYGSRAGWGLKYEDTAASDVDDPKVISGCPQCGTFLYRN